MKQTEEHSAPQMLVLNKCEHRKTVGLELWRSSRALALHAADPGGQRFNPPVSQMVSQARNNF